MKATALAGWVTATALVGTPATAGAAEIAVHVRLGERRAHHEDGSYRSHGAQGRYRRAPAYRGGYGATAARVGFDRGYSEGLKEGIEDARRHRRFEFWREKTYRRADRGYRSEFGPRPVYSRAFREGYEAGYRRGYASPGYRRGYSGRGHHHRGARGLCYDTHRGPYVYERPRW